MGVDDIAHDAFVERVQGPKPAAQFHSKTILLVLAVYSIYFVQTANIVSLGAHGRDITAVVGGVDDLVWITSIVTIITVVLSPPVSQAADYWGRKWPMIISTTFGFVGSLVLSRSNSIGMALAGIALTGVSYGAQPLALAVPSEVLPRKYRSYAQAGANIAASIGLISTLYIGGALMRNGHHAGFRILAYIMAGIYAFSTIVVFLLYNPPPRKLQVEFTLAEKLRRLDWIGYILLTTGLVVFCLGLSWAKNPYPWNDARVLAPFLIGVALTACFVVYEWRLKSDGMLHHGLFRHRNFPLAMVCIFGEGIVFFCANNYISFRASVYYTTDPLRLGLNYSIIFWTAIIVSLVAGWVISRTKTLREVLCLSFVMFLTFWILMATCTPETPEANIWGYPVILGIGLALCLVTVVTTGQLAVSAELISLSSGLMVAMRSLGGSVGIAIYNAIFNSIFENDLAPKIAGAVLPLGLPQSSLGPLIQALTAQNEAALAQVPGANQGIIHAAALALLDVYSVAFRYVFVAAGALSLIGLIAATFVVNPTKEFNRHIDAPAEQQELVDDSNGPAPQRDPANRV